MTHPEHVLDPILKPRRRDVLFLGAGLALAPSVAWGRRARREALAVGFSDTMLDLDAPQLLAPIDVVAADRLDAGEVLLADGARITVHGLLGDPGALARKGIRAAELLVGFSVAVVDPSTTEFRAWSHQVLPIENAGTPVAFTAPADRGLTLALELDTLERERYEAVLSTGREPGAPKLRAGTYLIAPGAAPFAARTVDPAGPEPYLALTVEPGAC